MLQNDSARNTLVEQKTEAYAFGESDKVGQAFIHFYGGDWKKDPAVRMLSIAAKGFWFELILAMHEKQDGGKLEATGEQFGRIAGCSTEESLSCISEIKRHWVADVYETDGTFTIINRRMQRQWELREKRKQIGSIGGSKTASKREAKPNPPVSTDTDSDYDNDCIKLVREFARERGIPDSDADWFYWKCVGCGWTNRGDPIKDWRATLDSWFRAGYVPSRRNGHKPATRQPYRPGPEETPEKKREREQRRFDQLNESDKIEQERQNEVQRQKVKVLMDELKDKMKMP